MPNQGFFTSFSKDILDLFGSAVLGVQIVVDSVQIIGVLPLEAGDAVRVGISAGSQRGPHGWGDGGMST